MDQRFLAWIRELARHFPENGMKLLLENPLNVRDLLRILRPRFVRWIDFARLRVDPTTYIERDYRHVEADVVLRGPLKRRRGQRARRTVLIYILIEHQSEPDPLMPLRCLEYVVQIYKSQVREWGRRHRSFAQIRLQPVLPIVFYTGTRRWETPGLLVDLLERGKLFADVTPVLRPLFLNLGETAAGTLETDGGAFGQVLRLVQQRDAAPREFRMLLQHGVQQLETLPPKERMRWLELLSYLSALVYHDRDPDEQSDLQDVIENSVATDELRQEIMAMRKRNADVLMEKGVLLSRRETLLRLLQKRFKKVPAATAASIEAVDDLRQLDRWFDRAVTANTLEEVGISSS